MARIAIVSQWLLGHIVPILGVGAELANRGYEVLMLSHPSFRPLIEKAGLTYIEVSCGKYPHKFMADTLRELDLVMNQVKPDLIVCDSALSAPAYVAEKKRIPWVSYQTSVYWPDHLVPGVKAVNERMRALYAKELNALRQSYGLSCMTDPLRTRGDLAGKSSELHLMLFLEELMPAKTQLPPGSKIMGPCNFEPDSAAAPVCRRNVSGQPHLVLCTSSADKPGYGQITARYVDCALEAFAAQEVQLSILTHIPYANETSLDSNVHWITAFPNHHLLFPHADLIITHGGCGTLQQAIRYGIPMIIIPLGSDHTLAAKRCEELGIAIVMAVESIDAGSLGCAVNRALSDDGMKARIKRLSGKLDDIKSNRRCADEIEKILVR